MAGATLTSEEVLGSIRTVRSFACEKFEADKYLSQLEETIKYYKVRII